MSLNTPTSTFTFHHSQLGKLTGVALPEGVVQFKAIPYATIPARFKQSVLNETLAESTRDFTKLGYACPQILPDHSTGGGPFPNEEHPHPTDEFRCLTLQLNVPLSCLLSPQELSALPVLVYIHGGGFVLGKIDEQHSTALMVEQSLFDSKPIISASIQYRLGALGYLHMPQSSDTNLALNDQRNALMWIQSFIKGFGGDPNRATLFGESAGSMSICSHILAPPPRSGPLFNRVILMSGIIGPMTTPTSVEESEETYEKYLQELGIEERGEKALQKLRDADIKDIVNASARMNEGGSMWLTVRDEQFFGQHAADMTWDKIPTYIAEVDWVHDIILGTTSFEGTMFMDRMAGITCQEFLDAITKQTGTEKAKQLAQAYNMFPNMDNNLFLTQVLRWAGDVVFDAPNHLLAQELSKTGKKVYRYVFDVRNPFPNHGMYQQPHHWVDIYFVFKAHQFRYPSQQLKDISTRHAQLWIDFANGKSPWSEYKYSGTGDEVIMVADERLGWTERTVAAEEKITELSWKRCEALLAIWEKERGRSFYPFLIEPLQGKKLT